ncbi:MAG: hypothetical protein JKX98_06905, partial [Alcanivoracaceae bacterium]|nr:hypothetical protein [Alcanivoracaceae bacterium]
QDLSPESDQAYFAEGMSEELLNLFTQISGLDVASRTSSFSYQNKDMTLKQIGKELDVSYVMEGSVRKSGKTIRVTTQLIRIADGTHIWSETYDHQMQDIFKVQDEIAKAVSEQLELSLSKGMRRDEPVNPVAQSLYLKALYYFNENSTSSIKQALELINQSIKVDANFASAWTLKSRIYYQLAMYSYDKDDSGERAKAKQAVIKAMALDNQLATTHAHMALINLSDLDFDAARYNIDLALNLKDDSMITIEIVAQYYQLTGQIDKSTQLLEQISDLNPINDTHYIILATNQWISNDFKQAYRTIRKYGYFHANAVTLYAFKSHVLMSAGNLDKAKTESEKETNEFLKLNIRELLNFNEGNIEIADILLNELEQKYSFAPVHIALHYAARNDIDNTFKWLELALQKKDIELLYLINHPAFRKMWNQAQWVKFIDKIKLPIGHWLLTESANSFSRD